MAGVVAAGVLLASVAAARAGRPGEALVLLALGAVGLALAGGALARSGVLTFPVARRRGVNLVATRGAGPPTVWLMAHLDSKSQPVPILMRAAGITLMGTTWIAALMLAAVQLSGGAVDRAWLAVAVIGVAGAIPVAATTVGARSPGALDNASGVAAVLLAAEAAPAAAPLGICLTSAEELGLAGARAWMRDTVTRPAMPGGAVVINCDGVDDAGATTCMYSGRRPDSLVTAVVTAGADHDTPVRAHRLLPGVLTDSVAVADAGLPAVTLSKGGIRTLARIHTPRDRAEHLTGAGIQEVARLIVSVIERLNT